MNKEELQKQYYKYFDKMGEFYGDDETLWDFLVYITKQERKKTLEEVSSKIADMALEKWSGQIGKEILADTSEVISKLLKEGNEKEQRNNN